MPAAKKPQTPPRKPYLPRVSPPRNKTAANKAATSGSPSPGASARRWTAAEYLELFNYAISNHGSFDGAVEGRTRNQTYQAWRCTLLPFITNAVLAKDGGASTSPSAAATKSARAAAQLAEPTEELETEAKPEF